MAQKPIPDLSYSTIVSRMASQCDSYLREVSKQLRGVGQGKLANPKS